MKKMLCMVLVLLAACSVLRAGDPIMGPKDYMGESRFFGDVEWRRNADFVAGSTLKIAGTAVTGSANELNWAANRTVDSTANVTNTQVVTLDFTAKINVLKGIGQTDTFTNTITLSNVSSADIGKLVVVQNATGSTNPIAVALTGNYYGPALELSAGQSVMIYGIATNKLYSLGNQ